MIKKILLSLLILLSIPMIVYAGMKYNAFTGKLDETGQGSTVVNFDPANYGGVNWGSNTAFTWGFLSGSTTPQMTFGDGTLDFYNTAVTIHGTNSSFKFANNMFFNGDTARKLLLGSTGGTYNENIRIDNDTTTNTIGIDSTTGVTSIDTGTIGIRNTATNNAMGNVSIGTAGTGASVVSAAGNVSIGTAYAVAHAAPTNGAVIQGNVGIGTWLPVTALDVAGGTITAGALNLTSTTQGSTDYYEASANGTNKVTVTAPASLSADRTCTLQDDSTPFDNCVSGGATPGGNSGAIQYNSSGSLAGNEDNFSISGSNIGIGTNAPASSVALDIRGNPVKIWTGAGTDTNATAAGELYVQGDLEVDGSIYGDGTNITGISGVLSGMTANKVQKASNATTLADSVIYDNGTNVGIGTTSPGALLSVNGVLRLGTGVTGATMNTSISNGITYTYNFSADNSTRVAHLFSTASHSGSSGVGTVGLEGSGSNQQTGTGSYVRGVYGLATTANTSGTTDNSYGLYGATIRNGSGGTVTNAYSVYGAANTNTAGTTTRAYAGGFNGWTAATSVGIGTSNAGNYWQTAPPSGGLIVESNVGIGTLAPIAKLSVWSTATDTTPAVIFRDSTGAPLVTVLSNGNVGIGTLTPTSKLSIYGATVTQRINGANTACATTCGALTCFGGFDTALTTGDVWVDCADATADKCQCSK